MQVKKPMAIDLFCGCGGLTCGLVAAGFDVVAGVDIEPDYICTFEHNFPDAKAMKIDLSQVEPEVFMDMLGIAEGELSLLAGGPPCQGFSKNVPRRQRYLESTNNRLVKRFLDYCEKIKPFCVLMENVAEMKNGFGQAYTDEIVQRLQEEGYAVNYGVLNAADYGVPQRRRRAFFLGTRSGRKMQFPGQTHSPDTSGGELFPRPNHVTVWEAIGDLPSLRHGQGTSPADYTHGPMTDFQKWARGETRSLTNHVARKLQATQYERLASLEPGEGLAELPDHLRPKSGYSGAYGRLTKEMVAPTITRWVFHPGSGRWGHPVDIRVLTIREAARIQSFPDSFEFVGSYNQQAGQVGNAVPPLLAQRLGESVICEIESYSLLRKATKSSKSSFASSPGIEKVTA